MRSKYRVSELSSNEINFWLADRVCSAVAELTQRSDFKRLARWPLDRLCQGSTFPERCVIEQIDSALLQTASALASILERPSVGAAFSLQEPLPDSRGESNSILLQMRPSYSDYIALLSRIADRPWLDLACEDDYFDSTQGLNLAVKPVSNELPGTMVPMADLVPFLQPSLRYAGDFVFRCLLLRIDHWSSLLSQFSELMLKKLRQSQSINGQDAQDILAARQPVRPLLKELQTLYQAEGDAPLREACLVLLRAYVSYRPDADLNWLSLAPAGIERAGILRFHVARGDVRMIEAVAAAVREVKCGLSELEDVDSQIQELSKLHTLCIIQGNGRRELYWQGDKVDVDWKGADKPWALLFDLAEKARKGLALDDFDGVYKLKDAKYRLNKLIPPDLKDKIRASAGRYQLQLDPEQICIRIFQSDEVLRAP